MASPDLNVSLEPHLLTALHEIPKRVPAKLAGQLEPYLGTLAPQTVPYSVLFAVSQWARSPEFPTTEADAQNYTMISLLAGTRTSPERVFPKYTPPDPLAVRAAEMSDRQAITTLINALLSVLGAGFATWWAADMLGWSNQWRVLLALFVSLVVAISEAGLYLIWQSRISPKPPRRVRNLAEKKNDDPEDEKIEPSVVTSKDSSVRLRRPQDPEL